MESADNPKSMNRQEKAEISDQYKTKSDSFTIDVDSCLSNTITTNEISRTTRSLSRKLGMVRGGNKITNGQDHGAGDDESISPMGGGSSTIEKQAVVVVVGLGSREEVGGGGNGGALSHEIAITTVHGGAVRRNSFKRSSQQACSWYLDPRKIFLLCATLSCLGTTLLIYFAFSSGTVCIEKRKVDS